MNSQPQQIIDPSDLRKWRTELPNLYDDANLTPHEFRLLAHYKRVGNCFEGLETTAAHCHMSAGMVSRVRKQLAAKGFIKLSEQYTGHGIGRRVEIVDKWEENFRFFSNRKPSRGEGKPSRGEGKPSRGEGKPSPHEAKNKPFKNSSRPPKGGLESFRAKRAKKGPPQPKVDWLKKAEQDFGLEVLGEVQVWAASKDITDPKRIYNAARVWKRSIRANGQHQTNGRMPVREAIAEYKRQKEARDGH